MATLHKFLVELDQPQFITNHHSEQSEESLASGPYPGATHQKCLTVGAHSTALRRNALRSILQCMELKTSCRRSLLHKCVSARGVWAGKDVFIHPREKVGLVSWMFTQ